MTDGKHLTDTQSANRLPEIDRGTPFSILINGKRFQAYPGESVAAVLLVSGIRSFSAEDDGEPKNRLFCGMGVCHQCLVTIDGIINLRACMSQARPGMNVQTQSIPGEEHS